MKALSRIPESIEASGNRLFFGKVIFEFAQLF
jgi:hypothetical protein